MGTTNLNAILDSQNCVFEKLGTGYQMGFQGKQKKFSSFFKTNEQQLSSFMTCFYCMRKGHYVRNCKVRKFDVPKGKLGGCLKASLTHVDPDLTGYQWLKLKLFCRFVWHPRINCGTWTVDALNT